MTQKVSLCPSDTGCLNFPLVVAWAQRFVPAFPSPWNTFPANVHMAHLDQRKNLRFSLRNLWFCSFSLQILCVTVSTQQPGDSITTQVILCHSSTQKSPLVPHIRVKSKFLIMASQPLWPLAAHCLSDLRSPSLCFSHGAPHHVLQVSIAGLTSIAGESWKTPPPFSRTVPCTSLPFGYS